VASALSTAGWLAMAPGAPGSGAASPGPVTVTTSDCAGGWSAPADGLGDFTVTNRSDRSSDVALMEVPQSLVIGEIRPLGPGTTRTLTVRMAKGRYEWRCFYESAPTRTSAVAAVARGVSRSTATPGVLATTTAEMAGPIARYQQYLAGQLATLQAQVGALAGDVSAGNLAQAKADWLAAYTTWSTVGSTYTVFGPFSRFIDGLPTGFAGGVGDPRFSGLHKIESVLWGGQPAAAAGPAVSQLATDLSLAERLVTKVQIAPNDLSSQPHEIVEDLLHGALLGKADVGAGATLAAVAGASQGDLAILKFLTPLIDARAPHLVAEATSEFGALEQALTASQVNGQWVPVASLTPQVRQRIDADVDQLAVTLAPVTDLLEVQHFGNQGGI
jgi:iron uptake system EfeUOB component EfeO/EfeM